MSWTTKAGIKNDRYFGAAATNTYSNNKEEHHNTQLKDHAEPSGKMVAVSDMVVSTPQLIKISRGKTYAAVVRENAGKEVLKQELCKPNDKYAVKEERTSKDINIKNMNTSENHHQLKTPKTPLKLEKNINQPKQNQMVLTPQQICGGKTYAAVVKEHVGKEALKPEICKSNNKNAVKQELTSNYNKVQNLIIQSGYNGKNNHKAKKQHSSVQENRGDDEWKECAKKQRKKRRNTSSAAEVHFFSLPDQNSIAIDDVKLNSAGTKFQPEVAAALPELLKGKEIKFLLKERDIVQNNNEYTTAMPLLEERREILPNIWDSVQSEDVITGARTYRALAENLNDTVYTLTKKVLNKKEVYIFNFERTGSSQYSELHRRVYATITENIEAIPHSTFSYNTEEISGHRIHYLSEEDVYEKNEFYEIKILWEERYLKNNGRHYISPRIAYIAAIQCMTRRSKMLIVGFYNDTHVTVKLYTLDELIHIAKEGDLKVAVAKKMLEKNMKQIIQYIKENGEMGLNKTVIIKKNSVTKKLNFFVSE